MPEIYRDLPVGFHRVNRTPLDSTTLINGNAELFQHINFGTAYHGQHILVSYGNYDQPVILKKGKTDKLIPIMSMPSGYEIITKTYNDSIYALVYYYNGGTLFTNANQTVRLNDSFAWSLLPQASLFANSDIDIDYILEANDGLYLFNQANFTSNTVNLLGSSTISGISSSPSFEGFYYTNDPSIVIMPKVETNTIVKLWVKCDDYFNALGE